MVSRQLSWLRLFTSALLALLVVSSAPNALAQENNGSSALADVMKGVVFDPTTYAPALVQYDATMRDWKTSQPFFEHGYVERNARFTRSGLPNDMPLGYTAGRNLILRDTLTTLGVSAAQNLTSRVVERALLSRYPDHPKMVKTIGWVQRIAVASLMSYRLSATHYKQAELNAQRARELGYR
ncbi:MAG TPA: hypothetical protein VM818_07295 [Vicinamibacterales bacterium]|nr:hypothetical protein [Vicinamibacterales bacterium]